MPIYSYTICVDTSLSQMGAHGMTLSERAWLEHNTTSLSHIYENIHVAEVARMLGMESPQKAEKVDHICIYIGLLFRVHVLIVIHTCMYICTCCVLYMCAVDCPVYFRGCAARHTGPNR